tara:strand:+ start:71 stop:292 length:222 start_codon:yes stop_codon:yes gene_type:complete
MRGANLKSTPNCCRTYAVNISNLSPGPTITSRRFNYSLFLPNISTILIFKAKYQIGPTYNSKAIRFGMIPAII